MIKFIMTQKPTILILVGKGKTALTNIIKRMSYAGEIQNFYRGYEEVIKESSYIKGECEDGVISIVHLNDSHDFLKLPLGIRKRAVMFTLI